MDHATTFVQTRAAQGGNIQSVTHELVVAGWPQQEAQSLVHQLWPTSRPGGLWLTVAAAVCGVGLGAFVLISFASLFVSPGGPRELLAHLDEAQHALPVILTIAAAVWFVTLLLLVIHLVAYRRSWSTTKTVSAFKPQRTARVVTIAATSVLLLLNVVLAVLGVVAFYVVWGSLGVMCGEAVSTTCGL